MQTASVQIQPGNQASSQRAENAASTFGPRRKRGAAGGIFAALFARLASEISTGASAPKQTPSLERGKKGSAEQTGEVAAKVSGKSEARRDTVKTKGNDAAGALSVEAKAPDAVRLSDNAATAYLAKHPQIGLPKQAPVSESETVERKLAAPREDRKKGKAGEMAEGQADTLAAAILLRPDQAQGRQAAKQAPVDGLETGDARKRPEKRREDRKSAEVQVVDLRMRLEAEPSGEGRGAAKDAAAELASLHGKGEKTGDAGVSAKNAKTEGPAGRTFSEVLAARLGNEGATDIVKAAQIVLKDGDSGLIRLKLEPESLGSVKIELRLAEKSIEGRIVVESEDAKAAFEKALDGLRDAFAREGFESARLEVSVGGRGDPSGTANGQSGAEEPFWSERLRGYDEAVPLEPSAMALRVEGRVDILA